MIITEEQDKVLYKNLTSLQGVTIRLGETWENFRFIQYPYSLTSPTKMHFRIENELACTPVDIAIILKQFFPGRPRIKWNSYIDRQEKYYHFTLSNF